MPQEQNVYDTVAYPGVANLESHPDTLATLGMLYGLEPAPVATCRVLEIGCNEGHNLVPLAYAIPGGRFVGFDLAAKPIAAGRQRIARLGLTNVQLMQANLMEFDASLGPFDYVIAHGVYSWVPDAVRDGLMALIKKVLAPQGIAFVSYAALPGGHISLMVREMLSFHSAGTRDPVRDVDESLAYLQFLFESMSEKEPMRGAIERELKQMHRKGASVLFHDELSAAYRPVLYSDFVGHAVRHGLEPLCDAQFPRPTDPYFNPEISPVVNELSDDPVRREQTFDFIRMRKYRETLICHARSGSGLEIDFAAVERLRLASKVAPVPPSAPGTADRVFRMSEGGDATLRDPALIFVLELLVSAWPRSIAMTDIRAAMDARGFACDAAFLTGLFRLILARAIQMHAWQSPVAGEFPARPRVSAYCRDAAAHGTKAVSLLHTAVDMTDPTLCMFVELLDGSRDPAGLLDALRGRHPDLPEEQLVAGLQPALNFLYREGLFLDEDFIEPSNGGAA